MCFRAKKNSFGTLSGSVCVTATVTFASASGWAKRTTGSRDVTFLVKIRQINTRLLQFLSLNRPPLNFPLQSSCSQKTKGPKMTPMALLILELRQAARTYYQGTMLLSPGYYFTSGSRWSVFRLLHSVLSYIMKWYGADRPKVFSTLSMIMCVNVSIKRFTY